jgi:hypothetical protein
MFSNPFSKSSARFILRFKTKILENNCGNNICTHMVHNYTHFYTSNPDGYITVKVLVLILDQGIHLYIVQFAVI